MKSLKTVIVITITYVFISCGNNTANSNELSDRLAYKNDGANMAENLRKISLEIDGMTCEIGCARTIQSILSKTKGVKTAKVNFENEMGVVEFDSNKITQSQIVEVVEEIAGGDLYKVNDVKKSE